MSAPFHQAALIAKSSRPLLLAGRELVLAGVSFMASSAVVSWGYQHYIQNSRINKAGNRSDFPSSLKTTQEHHQMIAGAELSQAALSIGVYAGLSKLTTTLSGEKLYPNILLIRQRPNPLPIPSTIALASVAFVVLGPLASVAMGLMSAPLMELCYHNNNNNNNSNSVVVAEEQDVRDAPSKNSTGIVRTIQDGATNTTRTTSRDDDDDDDNNNNDKPCPLQPLQQQPRVQMSMGAKIAPLLEAAVPGSVTLWHPLWEEIFFRGQLLARLVPTLGRGPAALSSSILFGVLHQGAPATAAAADSNDGSGQTTSPPYYVPILETILGLACSFLYLRTGRLLVPFALHSSVNVCCVTMSALSSCPLALADQYFYAMDQEEEEDPGVATAGSHPPPRRELSFWERRVVQNWSLIQVCLVELASAFVDKASLSSRHDNAVPFLALDFWGTTEMVAKDSIFHDPQHQQQQPGDGLLKAPAGALCHADDGTKLSNFANALLDIYVDSLFAGADALPVDRMVACTMLEQRVRFALFMVATQPALAESSRLFSVALLSPPTEFVQYLEQQDWLDNGRREYIIRDGLKYIGYALMDFPFKTVITRSEFSNTIKKDCANCLRLGMHAELSQDLFIIYCIFVERGGDIMSSSRSNSGIVAELLSGYCELAAAIEKQQPDLYMEWEKKHKERTQYSGP